MIPKKLEREISGALRRMRWTLPLTALTVGAILPLNASAAVESEAAEVETFDVPTEVEAEVNEDSLSYLLLVDTFETAERIPSRRLSTPAEVVVITADEIDANHYQTVAEAISHLTGIVALNSPAQELVLVSGNRRVLTLVDGRRTFMHPPMKAIERIEIVKGGGSALYGSDAVGGVINIITKKGDHYETTVDINTGSWHRHTYEVTNQGNDGKLGWFIDAAIGKSRPYNYSGSEPANKYDKASDYNDRSLMLRLDHRFDERSSLTFDIMHGMHRYNQYNSLDADDYSTNPYDTLRKYTLRNQVSLAYNFKEGTSTPGFLRYFNNYESYDQLFRGGYEGNARLQGVDYQNGWELGQHKLIVGVEWHQDSGVRDSWQESFWSPNPETNSTLRDVKRKVTNQAYYIQDTISMGQKWTVVPGTRVDHNSQFGSQWSPKIAANYSPDDQTKIFASWGRVYQAPSSQQLYTNRGFEFQMDDIPYRYERWLGNPNLKPETGHTETIGIEHDFSDKVNASLSFFNAKIGNYLDMNDFTSLYANTYTPGVFSFSEYRYVNSSEDKQHGLNLTYRQKIDDHWSYNLGYAYTHRKRPLGDEAVLSHERAPKNSYMAAVRYRNGPWKASLMGVAGSGGGGDNYMEDDFMFLDFNVSCDVSEWATVYAKAINFTNQNRSYYGRRFNMPGRLFQVGLDCRF